jgi:hypothetical protein
MAGIRRTVIMVLSPLINPAYDENLSLPGTGRKQGSIVDPVTAQPGFVLKLPTHCSLPASSGQRTVVPLKLTSFVSRPRPNLGWRFRPAATVQAFDQQSFGRPMTPSGDKARRMSGTESSSLRVDVNRCQRRRNSGRPSREWWWTAVGRGRRSGTQHCNRKADGSCSSNTRAGAEVSSDRCP